MSMFGASLVKGAGAAPSTVVFSAASYFIFDSAGNPSDASSRIQLNDAGDAIRRLRLQGADSDIGTFGDGTLDITDYDFRMDTISGTLNHPTSQLADTWITGVNGMNWGVEETGFGTNTFMGTLRARPAGGGADIDTAGVSLIAEST